MKPSTVLLADDHTIVSDGLTRLLRDHGFNVVGAVNNGELLHTEAIRLQPDVIVTDFSMPGLSGVEVLIRLKAAGVRSKVIILTMHADAALVGIAMREGACGFLLKESAGEELITALRLILQGNVLPPPVLNQRMAEPTAKPTSVVEAELTPRQRDVLKLIVKGQRMKEIAAQIGLSVRTVETHKYEMMRNLDLHSTAELVRYALDRRLELE